MNRRKVRMWLPASTATRPSRNACSESTSLGCLRSRPAVPEVAGNAGRAELRQRQAVETGWPWIRTVTTCRPARCLELHRTSLAHYWRTLTLTPSVGTCLALSGILCVPGQAARERSIARGSHGLRVEDERNSNERIRVPTFIDESHWRSRPPKRERASRTPPIRRQLRASP